MSIDSDTVIYGLNADEDVPVVSFAIYYYIIELDIYYSNAPIWSMHALKPEFCSAIIRLEWQIEAIKDLTQRIIDVQTFTTGECVFVVDDVVNGVSVV